MPASCDIFIRSYYKDVHWLANCLRSIEKHCSGFRRIVLVVPESSRERVQRMKPRCDELLTCRDYDDDYLGQQATKLLADTLTDADFICHVDSDCVFRGPTVPGDLFDGERLRLFIMPYDRLPSSMPWRQLTQKFLNRDVAFEFMRRQPQTFPRWLYGALRAHCVATHGVDIETYITSQPPRGFSEFNAIGAYAHHYHHDDFAWVDLSQDPKVESLCHCFWSWGGLTPDVTERINRILE